MAKASVQTLLQDGMTAAKEGDVELARRSFAKVVQHDPKHEYGWLWLALVVDSTEQSIYCLKRVLELNPTNERAQKALLHLQETISAAGAELASSRPRSIAEVEPETTDVKPEAPIEADDPNTAELEEISKEATLVAQTETPEVKKFKKRFATGQLPNTGTLSLSDEWLPPDLLVSRAEDVAESEPKLEYEANDLDDRSEFDLDLSESEAVRAAETEAPTSSAPANVVDATMAAAPEAVTNANLDSPAAAPDALDDEYVAPTAPLQEPPKPAPANKPTPLVSPMTSSEAEEADALQAGPPSDPSTFERPSGPYILIVDDSQTVRQLVKLTLDRLGFNVIEAKDGFEALAQLANQVPDLILLDITMPRMDGYQVCRIIKENGSTRHIPVIMLSGKDGFFDRVKGRLAGATDYVTKPFEPGALYTSIQSHLEKNR